MPIVTKEYSCEECGDFTAEVQHDKQCKKCPTCKSTKIERLIGVPIVGKMGGPKTVGALMEENSRKNPLTREKVMGQSAEEAKEKADKAKRIKKLANLTPAQTQKYIHTGQLPT